MWPAMKMLVNRRIFCSSRSPPKHLDVAAQIVETSHETQDRFGTAFPATEELLTKVLAL